MIDAHHHFWKYTPEEYPWMGAGMETLRRDYLPEHLAPEIRAAGVEGVISVQARQTLAETHWLLDLADANSFIRGVVGWVPLASASLRGDLEALAGRRKLKAVRHVVQDEPDDDFILGDDFNRGVALLKEFDLRYDILIFERHLPQAIRFVDRHPQQVFILDHIAKPRIRDAQLEPWRTRLKELARRPNVYCKLSGMVTEADWTQWTEAQLKPYFDAALDAFGPRRLMIGSDWPVCTLACSYERWMAIVRGWLAGLAPAERAALEHETATEAYRL